ALADGDADERRDDRLGGRLDVGGRGRGVAAEAALEEDLAVAGDDQGLERLESPGLVQDGIQGGLAARGQGGDDKRTAEHGGEELAHAVKRCGSGGRRQGLKQNRQNEPGEGEEPRGLRLSSFAAL